MRITCPKILVSALGALLIALPALAAPGGPNGGNRCEVANATVDLEAQPPTLLLEGEFCDAAKTPTVWLSRDGFAEPVNVLSSGETSIQVDVTGFEFVQDARVWVVCGNGKPSSGCSMDLLINRDDADADPANEIQRIERSGVEVCLVGPDGGCANIEDADASPTNELQALSHTPGEICLSDGGCVQDQVEDADADPGNEIQILSKDGSTVSLSKGGGSVEIAGGTFVTSPSPSAYCEYEEGPRAYQCYKECECTVTGFEGEYGGCTCTLRGCWPLPPPERCDKDVTSTCGATEALVSCMGDTTWDGADGCVHRCNGQSQCEALLDPVPGGEQRSCTCRVGETGKCQCHVSELYSEEVVCTPPPIECDPKGVAMCGKVI